MVLQYAADDAVHQSTWISLWMQSSFMQTVIPDEVATPQQADMPCLVLLQYATDQAVRQAAAECNAFVGKAQTHAYSYI